MAMNLENLNSLNYYILEEYSAQKLIPRSALKSLGNIFSHFLTKRDPRTKKLTRLPSILISGSLSSHLVLKNYKDSTRNNVEEVAR
jgi:hypothetical protein